MGNSESQQVLNNKLSFEALKKAFTSCKKSGNNPQNHFAGVRKMVSIGSQTEREAAGFFIPENTEKKLAGQPRCSRW